jgi:hypothetical protein
VMRVIVSAEQPPSEPGVFLMHCRHDGDPRGWPIFSAAYKGSLLSKSQLLGKRLTD